MTSLLLLLFACSGEPDVEETFTPSPYLPDEVDPPVAQHTPEDIGEAIEMALQQVYLLNAKPVLTAYNEVIAGEDGYCPRYYMGDNGYYWFDQCTSTKGSQFSGYGFYTVYDNYYYPEQQMFTTGEVVSGAGSITTAEGYTLNLSGYVASIYRTYELHPVEGYQSAVHGTFHWNGPSADGTWLSTPVELDLGIYAQRHLTAGGKYVHISGGISGLDEEFGAIVFDSIALLEASIGGPCEQEPYGVISVRGPDGEWYDVQFDGPEPGTWEMDPTQCDGVGHLTFRGEPMGDVTVDFSVLYQFETAPW